VVDGSQSTFHIGPRPLEDFHETFPLNLTIAGFDPVAIDTVGAQILGIQPSLLRYLKWAAGKGLGTNNMEQIEILGTSIADAYHRDGASVVDFANARMQDIRILNYGACTGCLKLANQAYRYDKTGLPSAITLVMGPNATQNQVICHSSQGDVVLCGHCAAPTYFNQLKGCYVPGCPPRNEDLVKTLKDLTIHKESI
jgi:Ni,Fe-hydrogenase III small subunit